MEDHDRTTDPFSALRALYAQLRADLEQADPHQLLLTIDDDLYRFAAAWLTLEYALLGIVAGPVRKGRSSGAIDMVILAGMVCDAHVAADGDDSKSRDVYAWVNRQLRHAMRPETYLRVHGVEDATRSAVERVADLHALFPFQTAAAMLLQVRELLDVPDSTAP